MALISLKEYAERVGRSHKTVYAKYKNNGFKTTQKIGHNILIDENEPFVDGRIKSGLYRNWRKDIETGKLRKEKAEISDDER